MLKHFFFLVFILIFSSAVFAQNGFNLNKTMQLLNKPDEKSYKSHHSLVTYYQIFSLSDTSLHALKTDYIPIISIELQLNPIGKNLIATREGISGHINYKNSLKCNLILNHQLLSLPGWLKSETDSLSYIPKNGNKYITIGNFYSLVNIRGNISYKPYQFLTLQFGIDKHFLGNGYRSLFLSDNSGAYPYFTASLNVWHIHYISMTSFLRDIYYDENNDLGYKQKFGTFHYLSWNITPSINLNVFEAVLWRKADSSLYNGLNINYLNPVIFMRPVEYAQGSVDNALLGAGLNVYVYRNILFYSQFILDEFYVSEFFKKSGAFTNKYGYQLGLKDNATFNKDIKWLVEYNQVIPYTYSHYSTLQAFGNIHQPLAHPLGANFKEATGLLFYIKNNFYTSARFSYSRFGKDTLNSNYGKNIYKNFWDAVNLYGYYGHYILQGTKVSRYNVLIKTGYILKPEWNLTIEAGIVWQKEKTEIAPINYSYFFIGIKTLLYNDEWFE